MVLLLCFEGTYVVSLQTFQLLISQSFFIAFSESYYQIVQNLKLFRLSCDLDIFIVNKKCYNQTIHMTCFMEKRKFTCIIVESLTTINPHCTQYEKGATLETERFCFSLFLGFQLCLLTLHATSNSQSNNFSANSYLIFTRLVSNCSELKALPVYVIILRMLSKKSPEKHMWPILICQFGFAFCFLNAPMVCHFKLFKGSYHSHFLSHFHLPPNCSEKMHFLLICDLLIFVVNKIMS